MVEALDYFAVAFLVMLALSYAVYALGPANLKTWILKQIGRYFGLKVLSLFLKRNSACDGCAAAGTHRPNSAPRPKPVR